MIKKAVTWGILLALAVAVLCLGACSSQAPALEEVKDELVALVEGSYEINEIFFGKGLPTYERGGEYATEHGVYSDNSHEFAYYEYVVQEAEYSFTDQIKWAAEKIYTKDYLEEIYTMAFNGYLDENSGEVVTARYLDGNSWLMKYAFGEKDPFNILPGKRIYDFDSMKIVKPSNGNRLNVEISSHIEGESETLTFKLHFKMTEDGWRLDSPTY